MTRPRRADLLRTRLHDVARMAVQEAQRPPSPELEARHREEWPDLWRRLDRLQELNDQLGVEVGGLGTRQT